MTEDPGLTFQRKKEHIELCLTDKVNFKHKTNGFERYEFEHYAITEVEKDRIEFSTIFLKKKINYPFLISCMTGGTAESEIINERLAIAANELNIPMGVGSQRLNIENNNNDQSYKVIRKVAPSIPLMGNLGASQIVKMNNFGKVQKIVDLIESDAMVIHLNASQELMQFKGEPDFSGFLRKMEKLVKKITVPVIVKEVGAGISKKAAEKLLGVGVKGIDVAGAGGTSWSAVEILRSKVETDNIFWDWGLPTSFCIREVFKLKKEHKFVLIGSGGICTASEAAKAFALGADIAASAKIILQELFKNGEKGVVKLVVSWFEVIKNIMFLTGSHKINELKNRLILKDKLY
ncbi:MAG: type 2 isopentenyl-diphosphate Delta-isomerase [Ignavibacteriaceae bacterium]|nr:type 2 isopentenyl-diphosphate Delta-isomerase [Ignavibacteriaceae bacterium]